MYTRKICNTFQVWKARFLRYGIQTRQYINIYIESHSSNLVMNIIMSIKKMKSREKERYGIFLCMDDFVPLDTLSNHLTKKFTLPSVFLLFLFAFLSSYCWEQVASNPGIKTFICLRANKNLNFYRNVF